MNPSFQNNYDETSDLTAFLVKQEAMEERIIEDRRVITQHFYMFTDVGQQHFRDRFDLLNQDLMSWQEARVEALAQLDKSV